MPQLRVLFADDHIPDSDVPEQDLTIHYRRIIKAAFPHETEAWHESAVSGYPVMLRVLNALKDDDLDVVCANTVEQAKRLIRTQRFDIAIVDLGWYVDASFQPATDRPTAGFSILDEIKSADERLLAERERPTSCILYSSRMVNRADIVPQATRRAALPVLKNLDPKSSSIDVAVDSLRAAVKYLRAKIDLEDPTVISERRVQKIRDMLDAAAKSSIRTLEWTSRIVLFSFTVSLLLIVVGLILALSGKLQIGLVTSATSVIVTAFSQITRPLLEAARKDAAQTKDQLTLEMRHLVDGSASRP